MYKDGENIFYYITVMNEPYVMPAMPGDVKDGILKGMYKFRASGNKKSKLRAQLFGSGAILREACRRRKFWGEVWRCRGRLERNELQVALYRWN